VIRWAIGIAILLMVALLLAWSQRKTIATHYIDEYLIRNRVQARYTIADLGFGRQRLTGVVIGDADHPDLVADWVELGTHIGLTGVQATAIRAGHVRLRAHLIGGKVSLGAIDRLLPAPSGKPFALPAIYADVEDLRIRFVAPQGVAGLKIAGSGKLDDGFTGSVAAVSQRLTLPGCRAGMVAGVFRMSIEDARPSLAGPLRAGDLACGTSIAKGFASDVKVTLGEALDRWDGSAAVKLAVLRAPQGRLANVAGTIGFAGAASVTSGKIDLGGGAFASPHVSGRALRLAGQYRIGSGAAPQTSTRIEFTGQVSAKSARADPAYLAWLASAARATQGSPVAPLAAQFAHAASAAAGNFDLDGDVALAMGGKAGRIAVSRLLLNSASGAHVTLNGGDGLGYAWPGAGARIDGAVSIAGGGLPGMAVRVKQAAPGGPLSGNAVIAPYGAGPSRLALTPVQFRATPGGNTVINTTATLSGPLGDGHVDAISLPLAGVLTQSAGFALNPGCAPLHWESLATAGLALGRTALTLCPTGPVLVRYVNGRLDGGARIAAPHLTGKLGGTPLSIAANGAEVRLGDMGFATRGLAVRIGAPDRVTRLDFAQLGGKRTGGTITGKFAGGAGQIANVPLLLADAAGDWSLRDAKLALTGALTVSDAAPDPRFKTMAARGVTLTLANSRIETKGTLFEPSKNVKVADVAIVHDLGKGAGTADLTVPGIAFTRDFQPDLLTRLTFGVIADVQGSLHGAGHIAWNAEGVTSNGDFGTEGTDLAAAFGPVTGISGNVHFTDLLSLRSAPHQRVTLKTVNPGVAVENGEILFQTLPDARIQIERGTWPFAGGTLTLEPTLLDFGAAQERHMTFRVAGMDAGQFLQQFDFKNLDATGIFDGALPMVFDATGGRIEQGHLVVRPGGGTLAYVGEVSQKDLGFWGNMAFQALKSLKYKSLDVVMNGPLAGEVITEVRFEGLAQGVGAKRNFILDRLQKLPFIFNVEIKAPFRGLIDSAQSFYDPKRLIERNLPALLEEQEKQARPPAQPTQPIQPQESRSVP